jgi:hypothetical protein
MDRSMEEHLPGTLAPKTGLYEELNVFGSPSGTQTRIVQGDLLPPLPLGLCGDGCLIADIADRSGQRQPGSGHLDRGVSG